ncbi:extensin [Burkholderia pseudomultivorans]|uniref:extensin n=1 Tax=Burkholderia pseudomultivorans TaxID=1207504 RepID=UPI0028766A7C|nr:extensin [Burkholderia pseudomultivorans]MDS0791383.1 extensin [Burkholderia pseudomultivorans]
MTSTRKTLMIAGALLVAAAGTGYVMLLRADHRAIEEAGIGDSAAPAKDDHTVQGAVAPPQAAPAAAGVAPASVAAGHIASETPQPAAKPVVRPTVKVVTVDAQDSTPASPKPSVSAPAAPPAPAMQQAQSPQPAPEPTARPSRRREGLERHAAAYPSSANPKSETPETAALVRESAKLDPSLPPPPMSAYGGTGAPGVGAGAGAGTYRQGSSSSGANPVAAAMTEQLVRESSSIKSQTPANGAPTTAK